MKRILLAGFIALSLFSGASASEDSKASALMNLMKECPPLTDKIETILTEKFNLVYIFDTSIDDNNFVRNMIFETKKPESGNENVRMAFYLVNLYTDNKAVKTCILNYGSVEKDKAQKMIDEWAAQSKQTKVPDVPVPKKKDSTDPVAPKDQDEE